MIAADVLQEAEKVSQDGEGNSPSVSHTCSLEDLLVKCTNSAILVFVNFCDNSVLLNSTNTCLYEAFLPTVLVQVHFYLQMVV